MQVLVVTEQIGTKTCHFLAFHQNMQLQIDIQHTVTLIKH